MSGLTAPAFGCMGGFCGPLRESCALYHQTDAVQITERACMHGRADEYVPLTPTQQPTPLNRETP